MQLTPEQEQVQMLAAKERERADDARFASNLVYARSPQLAQEQPGQATPSPYDPAERRANSNLMAPDVQGKRDDAPGDYKPPVEANIDSATGQPYLYLRGIGSRHCFDESPRWRRCRTSQSLGLKPLLFARSPTCHHPGRNRCLRRRKEN
jgi:hypothetical protein